MTNKKLTMEFAEQGEINDIYLVEEISNSKKTYIFMTT